jgi:tetratricopeptide (TPR) repeat protein
MTSWISKDFNTIQLMVAELKRKLKREDEDAIDFAEQITRIYPTEELAHSNLAFAYKLAGQNDKSILAYTAALSLTTENNLPLLLQRALLYLRMNLLELALVDLCKGVEISIKVQETYYRNALLFTRADIYITQGNYFDAKDDLSGLPDDACFWTTQLRKRDEMMKQIIASIGNFKTT